MPYDSPMFLEIIEPMREELTRVGFEELRTPEAVDEAFAKKGLTMCVVNSICGCAAGIARPAIAEAIARGPRPDHLVTVFAGQDVASTKQARSYFTGRAPSSPSIALLKDGQFVYLMERHQIEGHSGQEVMENLIAALKTYSA